MQEIYILTVTTVDGKFLIQSPIISGYSSSFFIPSQSYSHYASLSVGLSELQTLRGSGIQSFASGSSLPMES